MNEKVYIIKPYNKYIKPEKEEKILYNFRIHDIPYCISEVILEWGQPIVARPLQEQDTFGFHLYNTYEEAMEFVLLLKQINR